MAEQQIGVTAFWQELAPDDMFMRQHIGELSVGDGRKWEVCGSLNGMSLFVDTDIPLDQAPERSVSKVRRFVLHGSGLIKALASELLEPQQQADANEALAPGGE